MRRLRGLPALALCGLLVVSGCGGDPPPERTGTAVPAPTAESTLPDLSRGGATVISFAPSFVDRLARAGGAPGALGDGTLDGADLRLPVTAGNLSSYAVAPRLRGELDHGGSGLLLTSAARRLELAELVLDPGIATVTARVVVDGELAAQSVPLLTITGLALAPGAGQAVLTATELRLTAQGGRVLDGFLGTTGSAGVLVGTLTSTVATP
jgi:hypothetical protein